MKFAASHNVKRASVALALSATLLAGTTGCTFINTFNGQQPTTIEYAASDGVHFTVETEGEKFEARNIMLISEGNGEPGRVLGTLLNKTSQDQTFTLELPIEGYQPVSITVPAGEKVRLEDEDNQLIVSAVDKLPGEMYQDSRGVIGDNSTTFNLPVLDGTLKEYKDYLPNAASADSGSSEDFESEALTEEEATASASADSNNG